VLTLREASYALFGAWRLAHFDVQGAAYFDRSPDGALRSFWAAAILLPAYAVMVLMYLADHPPALGWTGLIFVYGLEYVLRWTAFPVAMIWLTRLLDCEARYFGWLAMYNWSQVLATLAILPLSAVISGGLLPEPVLYLLGPAVYIALFAYLWFIARAGLGIGPLSAIGVVLTDLTLSELIGSIANHISGGGRIF
jgi:hypothetical protein